MVEIKIQVTFHSPILLGSGSRAEFCCLGRRSSNPRCFPLMGSSPSPRTQHTEPLRRQTVPRCGPSWRRRGTPHPSRSRSSGTPWKAWCGAARTGRWMLGNNAAQTRWQNREAPPLPRPDPRSRLSDAGGLKRGTLVGSQWNQYLFRSGSH